MQRDLEPRNEFKQELRQWFIDEVNTAAENSEHPPVEDGVVGFDFDRPGGTPWRARLFGAVAVLILMIGGMTWLERPDAEPRVARQAADRDAAMVLLPEPSQPSPTVDIVPSARDDDGVTLDAEVAVLRAFERFVDPGVPASVLDLGDLTAVRNELGTLRRAYGEIHVVDVTVAGDRGEVTFEVASETNGDFEGLVFAFERATRSGEWAITAESLCAVAAILQRQCPTEDQS